MAQVEKKEKYKNAQVWMGENNFDLGFSPTELSSTWGTGPVAAETKVNIYHLSSQSTLRARRSLHFS